MEKDAIKILHKRYIGNDKNRLLSIEAEREINALEIEIHNLREDIKVHFANAEHWMNRAKANEAQNDELGKNNAALAVELEAAKAHECVCIAEHDAYQHMATRALRAEAKLEAAKAQLAKEQQSVNELSAAVQDMGRENERLREVAQ